MKDEDEIKADNNLFIHHYFRHSVFLWRKLYHPEAGKVSLFSDFFFYPFVSHATTLIRILSLKKLCAASADIFSLLFKTFFSYNGPMDEFLQVLILWQLRCWYPEWLLGENRIFQYGRGNLLINFKPAVGCGRYLLPWQTALAYSS